MGPPDLEWTRESSCYSGWFPALVPVRLALGGILSQGNHRLAKLAADVLHGILVHRQVTINAGFSNDEPQFLRQGKPGAFRQSFVGAGDVAGHHGNVAAGCQQCYTRLELARVRPARSRPLRKKDEDIPALFKHAHAGAQAWP